MRPVTELASDVSRLDPSRRNERLGKRFSNREVGVIAAAFDDYMERLDRVLEREQAFTEDASHELRTPLAIIASAAELLLEEPELSAPGRERILRIRRASTQMQSLIEALLFLARGESSEATQSCALDQIVHEAVEVVATGAALKSLQLNVEVEPVTVAGTPVMVACVVNNLLLERRELHPGRFHRRETHSNPAHGCATRESAFRRRTCRSSSSAVIVAPRAAVSGWGSTW